MINKIDGRGKTAKEITCLLGRPSHLDFPKESGLVREILEDLRKRGKASLFEYTEKFDGVKFSEDEDILVSKEEFLKAYEDISDEFIGIIKRAKKKIWDYHSKQREKSWFSMGEDKGVTLGQKISPMERVGIYVPGGRAAYPSSVLMNAIPAQIAGVEEIIMATPPGRDGKVNPATLVAAHILGIDKVYKMGGAQSIGAMAYGIDPVPRVDKITGPGNIYVTLAKKEVYGYVDIDMIAGPSEIVVIADRSARQNFVAADLLSQAEHDPLATSILITDNEDLFDGICGELKIQLTSLPKAGIARDALDKFGAVIFVEDTEKAIDLSNEIAPEHLELSIENPFESLGLVKNAGSIFLGHFSPEPLGDYMAGPNHILPTSGTARFFSPLSVDDFYKKSGFMSYSKEALRDVYGDIAKFARAEGLDAHARSVEVRFEE